MSRSYTFDINNRKLINKKKENVHIEDNENNNNSSSRCISEDGIYLYDNYNEKREIVSIENKLNKIIWLIIGILLLLLLSIILFWSVTLTCLNCIRLYYYLTDDYVSIDPMSNSGDNSNDNSTGTLLLDDGNYNVLLEKLKGLMGVLTNKF